MDSSKRVGGRDSQEKSEAETQYYFIWITLLSHPKYFVCSQKYNWIYYNLQLYILNIYEWPYYKFIQVILLYFIKLLQMTFIILYYVFLLITYTKKLKLNIIFDYFTT
jgi:hypothetical protein